MDVCHPRTATASRYPIFVRVLAVIAVTGSVLILACGGRPDERGVGRTPAREADKGADMQDEMNKTDEEWREILNPEQYRIMRQGGTEPPFTGRFNDFKGDGVFVCAGCRAELFSSDTKYNSGSGWPSFWAPVSETHVKTLADGSHGMMRVEVRCASCDAHLGHVFEDGPKPTGLRYCINSAALDFVDRPSAPDSGR